MSRSPPTLDSLTSNLPDDFLNQKQKEKALFESLKSRSTSRSTSNARTTHGSSVTSSSASSFSSRRKTKEKTSSLDSRNVLDLLPRGRESSRRKDAEDEAEEEEDEASLLAQAEALADLERLNGVEPSIPISTFRDQDSDNEGDSNDEEGDDANQPEEKQPYEMDVDEFRRYFGESWQLSQFW